MRTNRAQIGFWRTWTILTMGVVACVAIGAFYAQRSPDQAADGANRLEVEAVSRLAEATASSAIDTVRAEALGVRNNNEAMRVSGHLRAWAEVEGRGQRLGRVLRSLIDPSRLREFETASLLQAIEQVKKHAQSGAQGPMAISNPENADRLWLAFPSSGESTVFALVDPSEIFSAFASMSKPAPSLRAFVVSDSGRVLAHTFPSYVGTSFRDLGVFRDAFLSGAIAAGPSVDRVPVLARVRPLGNLTLQVGVEMPRASGVIAAGMGGILPAGSRLPFAGMMVFVLAWAFWIARQLTGSRREPPTVEASEAPTQAATPASTSVQDRPVSAVSNPPAAAVASPAAANLSAPRSTASATNSAAANPSTPGAGATAAGPAMVQVGERWISSPRPVQAHSEFEQSPISNSAITSAPRDDWRLGSAQAESDAFARTLRGVREDAALVERFETASAGLTDPRSIGRNLVSIASELTRSPTLFFLCQPRSGIATLAADAGLADNQSPAELSFPVSSGAATRISEAQSKGEIASLTSEEGLTRVLMSRMGVAHFEAWAIAVPGPLGHGTNARLLGILVILQSGVDSYARRDSLSRLLRSTGRIYERTHPTQSLPPGQPHSPR